MKTFQSGEMRVAVKVNAGQVRLTWFGQSNTRDPKAMLAPLVQEITPLLTQERDVELDFRELDYMNSSTFRPLLQLVQAASKATRSVSVLYDGRKNWQRLSFKTLEAVTSVLGNVRFAS
jgi:hypothetical protein